MVGKEGGIGKDIETQQMKTSCKKKYAEKGALEFCEDKEKESCRKGKIVSEGKEEDEQKMIRNAMHFPPTFSRALTSQ